MIDAARKLKAALDGRTLEELAGQEFRGEFVVDWTTKLGPDVDEPVTHLAYAWATQVVILDDEGRLAKVVAAHDVGRAINPTLVEGQIEGAVHMGLGQALSEEFVVEGGVPRHRDAEVAPHHPADRDARGRVHPRRGAAARRARTARRASARRRSCRPRRPSPARSTRSTASGARACR